MAQLSKATVSLTSTAIEVNKGIRYEDRVAPYHNGSGTDTLTFKYTVQVGDDSSDLEAKRLLVDGLHYEGNDFGNIFRAPAGFTSQNKTVNRLTHPDGDDLSVLANTWNFPTKTTRARYMESKGSSLAFNENIVIDTQAPKVVKVQAAPNVQIASGTFGVGEDIYISVDFSHAVSVYTNSGAALPYLILETGSINRKAYYSSTSGSSVIFKYTVQVRHVNTEMITLCVVITGR